MEAVELPTEWAVSKRQQGGGKNGAAAGSKRPREEEPSTGDERGGALVPVSGPLGPRSVFDASAHDAPERGQVRDMVLASLAREPGPSGGIEEIEVDCLLCKLPYKKMLSDLFGGQQQPAVGADGPQIPYVTRAYEESFMREPVHPGERKCAKGKTCECMFIDPEQPFVGVEFLLPGERQPPTPHMCVLCCRAVTQQLYYDVVFDKQASRPRPPRGGDAAARLRRRLRQAGVPPRRLAEQEAERAVGHLRGVQHAPQPHARHAHVAAQHARHQQPPQAQVPREGPDARREPVRVGHRSPGA